VIPCRRAYSFVKMANAEYNRLEKDGQGAAANDGLKLLLQIAAKSEFLANPAEKARGIHARLSRSPWGEALARHSFRRRGKSGDSPRIQTPR